MSEIFPIHKRLLDLDNAHELSLHYWLHVSAYLDKSDYGGDRDKHYVYTQLKIARDTRIRCLLESLDLEKDSPSYWQHFYGYVTDAERHIWEKMSGLHAIMPE
jgi:hypothetical protein